MSGQVEYRIRSSLTQLLAVALGVLPIAAVLIWTHLARQQPIEIKHLLLYPMIFGGGGIVLIIVLYRFMCGERIATLNLQPGRVWSDVLVGVLLALLFIALILIQQLTITRWFPTEPAAEIITLIEGLSRRPVLLAIWLGPVVWIGVAAFEELIRVFVLNRLWCVWPGASAQWVAIFGTAALFGLAHWYQGPVGVISTGVMGLIAGGLYLTLGRVWPLIIGHALFDSASILLAVIMIRQGAI